MAQRFTAKQGQYLAFLHYYTLLNGQAPSEADMERHFQVTPPSVHQMVLTLEAKGLIERTPGVGRSIRVLVAQEELPPLQPRQGPERPTASDMRKQSKRIRAWLGM